MHAQAAEHIDPFNRALGVNAQSMMWNPQLPHGLAALDGLISRAALQVAYQNDFLFLFYTSIPALLLVWLMARTVTRPILGVAAMLKDIASGEGDLTRRLPTLERSGAAWHDWVSNDLLRREAEALLAGQ